MKKIFTPADILLPDFSHIDGRTWACIACDQFTSEEEYWRECEREVGRAASSLRLILPEIYLSKNVRGRTESIWREMDSYLSSGMFREYPDSMIYVERTVTGGAVRHGIVGKIDLECYDYSQTSSSPVRATEGTVVERIPPRAAVRRGAALELPHVMLLIDDVSDSVMNCVRGGENSRIYDFDLMAGGGHVCGSLISPDTIERIMQALDALPGDITFAVGDGNHSLASAKAHYEYIKSQIGEEAAKTHPARYALVEVVNIHDPALVFEPIYRVMFGVDPHDVVRELRACAENMHGDAPEQHVSCISGKERLEITFESPCHSLTVGTLQKFIDEYISRHPSAKVDYIHGEASLTRLAGREDAIGFLFDGMSKSELFSSVSRDGALPRKTFSMGEARDKRYYIEARKIK